MNDMEFRVDCGCGDHIMVSEGAAGARFDCACGRAIHVPSLSELRTRAGLPTNAVSPEFVIEHLLASGQMPMGPECIECGANPCPTILVTTECERATIVRSGGFSWPIFLFCLFLCQPLLIYYLWALFFFQARAEESEFGRDKVYALPLRICTKCEQKLRDSATVKQCLCKVVEYQMLLEKFPNAKVSVGTASAR